MTKKLFTSLDVYHDIDSRTASVNMAIDEALLETAAVPTIRFYQWDHPALSFGYFGKFEDVRSHDRDIVRRWTGGGIVFHGEDLTYSIVIPASDPAFGESSASIYEKTHHAIRVTIGSEAKLEVGRDAALQCQSGSDRPRTSQRDVPTEMCFANPVRADVMSNGRKVAGAAQRRTRRGLLQQGSIQNVVLGNDFGDLFAKTLCPDCRSKEIGSALAEHAQAIAKDKYGTPGWLHRR